MERIGQHALVAQTAELLELFDLAVHVGDRSGHRRCDRICDRARCRRLLGALVRPPAGLAS
jgi:hypothetical protein